MRGHHSLRAWAERCTRACRQLGGRPGRRGPRASAAALQGRSKSKSSKGLGSMMSVLGRKPKDSGDPVKDLVALGYHEDDCRVRDPAAGAGGVQMQRQAPAAAVPCTGRRSIPCTFKRSTQGLPCQPAPWQPVLHVTARTAQTEAPAQRALFLHANEMKAAKEWLTERFGPPTSQPASLGTDSPRNSPRSSPARPAPRGYEFRPDPSSPHATGALPGAQGHAAGVRPRPIDFRSHHHRLRSAMQISMSQPGHAVCSRAERRRAAQAAGSCAYARRRPTWRTTRRRSSGRCSTSA